MFYIKHYSLSAINISKLPKENGVYMFHDKNRKTLYVGKSVNLVQRIRSYFIKGVYGKTKNMINDARYVSYIVVNSEIEALLLEANLINKFKPKYNISLKDDKKPLYIVITNERYPKVQTARKINVNEKNIANYGPFPSSRNVKLVLKMVRRIFPYSTHKISNRKCIYSQIGLCDPCPNLIENIADPQKKNRLKQNYVKNITYIKTFLDGNITSLVKKLENQMKIFSDEQKYEQAKLINDQIKALSYVTSSFVKPREFIRNPNLAYDIRKKDVQNVKKILDYKFGIKRNIDNIECYDVSHLSGTNPTASMVSFINGQPDKSKYKRFKILQKKGSSDTDSLTEVAIRRKKHLKDWGMPDLIVIDGGRGQVSVFNDVFLEENIPIIGIAKQNERLVYFDRIKSKFLEYRPKIDNIALLIRMRNEAHRFSRNYHHLLMKKTLFS